MQTKVISVAILLSFILFGGVGTPPLTPTPTAEPAPEPSQQVSYETLDDEDRKQVDCLADNIYFEARSEPLTGQKAVALVTMNRVTDKNFPKTVCDVVKQKKSSVCQFSWWCNTKARAQSMQRRFHHDHDTYMKARQVAFEVYINYDQMHDVTKGAIFYHADYVSVTRLGMYNLKKTVHIGQHIFYRI